MSDGNTSAMRAGTGLIISHEQGSQSGVERGERLKLDWAQPNVAKRAIASVVPNTSRYAELLDSEFPGIVTNAHGDGHGNACR
jgi:hypothetical protein